MKNTPHEITVEGLNDWLRDAQLQYASDSYTRKRLYMEYGGWLRVTVAGETIYNGKSETEAVEAYNNITEKYIDPTKDFRI